MVVEGETERVWMKRELTHLLYYYIFKYTGFLFVLILYLFLIYGVVLLVFLLFLYCLHLFVALSRPPVTPNLPHGDKEVLSYLFLLTIFKAKLQKKLTFNVCTILEAKLIKKILKKYLSKSFNCF